MKTRYCCLAMALAFAAVQARAQDIHLGPQLGIYDARDADNATVMGGVALRIGLMPGLGVEGSVNYRQEDYAGGKVTARSWPVMVTGLIYPLPFAYGAIGAGWYNTSLDYHLAQFGLADVPGSTQQRFGWHFGAGVELPMGRGGELVGDIRYVFLNYNFKTFPGSAGLNSDFYVITVGYYFRL